MEKIELGLSLTIGCPMCWAQMSSCILTDFENIVPRGPCSLQFILVKLQKNRIEIFGVCEKAFFSNDIKNEKYILMALIHK